jgi:hypothetical protein
MPMIDVHPPRGTVWVLLQETAEAGRGIAGTASGQADLAAARS